MLRNLPDPDDPEQVHAVVRGRAKDGTDGFEFIAREREAALQRSFENTPGLTPTLQTRMQEEPTDEPPRSRRGHARPVGDALDGNPNIPLQSRLWRGSWSSSRGNTGRAAGSSTDR